MLIAGVIFHQLTFRLFVIIIIMIACVVTVVIQYAKATMINLPSKRKKDSTVSSWPHFTEEEDDLRCVRWTDDKLLHIFINNTFTDDDHVDVG